MSDNDRSQRPPTRGQRFLKLASMTAAVAGNYAADRVRGAFQKEREDGDMGVHRLNGERIAQTLGELKGAAMKIGQMASIGSDLLPKELTDALSRLQKDSPPMPWEAISGQIERELGAPPEALFDHFDRTPFAAASIGQVHRARTDDGREVVVKIQYPGVDDSVDSDLSHLKFALRASGLLNKAHKGALNDVFEEIRRRLHEELDYCNEADNVRRFRSYHAQHEGIVVPDVVGERSAQRVLTLTYEWSDSITSLDDKGYTQEARDQIGQHLMTAMAGQLFELRALQSDPNPANYGFRPDGTVVLYDFGCVKEVDPQILVDYKAVIRAGLDEDYAAIERGLLALGARNPNGPPVPLEMYKPWRDLFLEPLIAQPQPYDYGTSGIHERASKLIPDFLKRLNSFQPPVELVFIDRTIGGQYGNLRKIRARGEYLPGLLTWLDDAATKAD